jgi:hypothetical protein
MCDSNVFKVSDVLSLPFPVTAYFNGRLNKVVMPALV